MTPRIQSWCSIHQTVEWLYASLLHRWWLMLHRFNFIKIGALIKVSVNMGFCLALVKYDCNLDRFNYTGSLIEAKIRWHYMEVVIWTVFSKWSWSFLLYSFSFGYLFVGMTNIVIDLTLTSLIFLIWIPCFIFTRQWYRFHIALLLHTFDIICNPYFHKVLFLH